MNKLTDSTFEAHLDVVATLAENAISASLVELRKHDELTVGLRAALKQGANIDDLSAASGLTPEAIRKRAEGALVLSDDLDELVGLR